MLVKLHCGAEYDFHTIKSITDLGNGTLEIVGNFKPRGKYQTIVIFIISIENWEEVSKEKISLKPYFCSECKKLHKNGEIFEAHKKYYMKKDEAIPSDKILEADLTKLKEFSKRQLKSLMDRMKWNPNKTDLYTKEINKLLIYEGVVTDEEFLENYQIK